MEEQHHHHHKRQRIIQGEAHEHHRHVEMQQHREDPSLSSWIELAKKTKVRDLLQSRKREFAHGITRFVFSDSLKHVLEVLQKQNILSAPVMDKELIGMIDIVDIAYFALDFYNKRIQSNDWKGDCTADFFNKPVGELINYSANDLPYIVDEDSHLADVIRLFGGNGAVHAPKPHRATVMNSDGMICGIISQSDLVWFINSTKSQLPASLLSRTMTSLNQVKGCVSCRLDTPFSETLSLLYLNKVGAVALLDDQFRLCGNFSASDLTSLSHKSFDYFSGSTIQFLTKGTHSKSSAGPPLWIGDEVALELALDGLVSNKLHRVYITNTHGLPTGVFSLTDALSIFAYLIAHSHSS